MGARERTGEILEMKKRNPRDRGFLSLSLSILSRQWQTGSKDLSSLPDFYLIRAVTILEVSTRQEMARLIDHSANFTERAVEFSKNFKMDFATVRGIQDRAVTLGDIVAHSVPVNAFGQILDYFGTLLGKPMPPLITGAVNRWRVEIKKEPPEPIIPDFDALRKRLSRLFEIRHILCHELPEKPAYQIDEVAEFLNDSVRFTEALEEVLTFEKFGLTPLTQTDMNVAAGQRLRDKDEELSSLLTKVREQIKALNSRVPALGDDRNDWILYLDEAQNCWVAYRNAHCEFVTYLNKGRTIRPLLWASQAVGMTKARITEIQSWFNSQSRRLGFDLEGQDQPAAGT
jgi:uncharacterized protein YecT (DUF1311 family)